MIPKHVTVAELTRGKGFHIVIHKVFNPIGMTLSAHYDMNNGKRVTFKEEYGDGWDIPDASYDFLKKCSEAIEKLEAGQEVNHD